MVDTFLLLTLARTGDSLQGIKKGVLELADVIAVNKADGDRTCATPRARPASWPRALHLVAPSRGRLGHAGADVQRRSSAVDLDTVWDQLAAHRRHLERTGRLAEQRRAPGRAAGCGRRSTTACWPASAPPCKDRVAEVEADVRGRQHHADRGGRAACSAAD